MRKRGQLPMKKSHVLDNECVCACVTELYLHVKNSKWED